MKKIIKNGYSLILLIFLIPMFLLNNSTIDKLSSNASQSIVKQSDTYKRKPFYKDINQPFKDYDANVHKEYGGSNNSHTSVYSNILAFTDYASDGYEFKQNYGSLELSVYMDMAFNGYNIVWTSSSLTIPLSYISYTENNASGREIKHYSRTTTERNRGDRTNGQIDYKVGYSENYIAIRFRLHTGATNYEDNYYYTINCQRVRVEAINNLDYINRQINSYLNGSTIEIDSSCGLENKNNCAQNEKNGKIDQLIKNAIGTHYFNLGKPYRTITDNKDHGIVTIGFSNPSGYGTTTWRYKINYDYKYKGLDNKLKSTLNKTISVDSDYSSALGDSRNQELIKKSFNQTILGALGSKYYEIGKSKISYAFDDQKNQVITSVIFQAPDSNQKIIGNYITTIRIELTQAYGNKSLGERLQIIPGKVLNPNDPNGELILDSALDGNGKKIYGTTATFNFNGIPDDTETVKINDSYVDVYNKKFQFKMSDHQEHNTNEYNILIERHNASNFEKIEGKYEVNYTIKQNVPLFNLKGYAGNPDKNPHQKELISQYLSDGQFNPKYDKEINPTTGTKKQIVGVKRKAPNPFPLDPLSIEGEEIKDKNYDFGYIAEGVVSGMGIQQLYDDPGIKEIKRTKLNSKLELTDNIGTNIISGHDGRYFSDGGIYLYKITDQKGFNTFKIAVIGQEGQNKYARFLDVIDGNYASSLGTTTQGFHLKNYLFEYKNLKQNDLESLEYERVVSYGKEYISNYKTNIIQKDKIISKENIIDLSKISLDTIKINSQDENILKDKIIANINKQMSRYDLSANDFIIKNLETKVANLLNSKDYAEERIDIIANQFSPRALGSTSVKVINSININEENIIDLSEIKFGSYIYNFSTFNPTQLEQGVLKAIEKSLNTRKIDISYDIDYIVNMPSVEELEDFIANNHSKLNIKILAKDDSYKTINSTFIMLINSFDSTIAPEEPPDRPNGGDEDSQKIIDELDKNENNEEETNNNLDKNIIDNNGENIFIDNDSIDANYFKRNLAWLLPTIIFSGLGILTGSYLIVTRHRKKIR